MSSRSSKHGDLLPLPEHRSASRVAVEVPQGIHERAKRGRMAAKHNGQIVDTAAEVRLIEPGPSILALLTMSTGLAVLIFGGIWFAFFRM
jgi:hypothetical protein